MKVDQLKGKWLQFKGALQQQWGKLIGDELQQIEGSYEKIIGMLQERYGSKCVTVVRERYGEKKNELISWAAWWQQQTEMPGVMSSAKASWTSCFVPGVNSAKRDLTK